MEEVKPTKGLDEAPDAKDNAFEHAAELTLITNMRIYDVLLAIYRSIDKDKANDLMAVHADGKILASLPWLDLETE